MDDKTGKLVTKLHINNLEFLQGCWGGGGYSFAMASHRSLWRLFTPCIPIFLYLYFVHAYLHVSYLPLSTVKYFPYLYFLYLSISQYACTIKSSGSLNLRTIITVFYLHIYKHLLLISLNMLFLLLKVYQKHGET